MSLSVENASIDVLEGIPEQRSSETEGAGKLKRNVGLAATSAAGAAIVAGALAPTAMAQQPLLSQGSQGDSVSQVQRGLGESPTGFFGPHTRADVISFQQNHKLLVDGIVGPQTRGALFSSNSSSSGHSTAKHTTTTKTRHSGSSAGSGGSSVPSYIVQCESGGNYRAVNPSTGAGGAYQIMPSTWRAYGGSGSPQNASQAQQDQIASKIYQAQGSSPWSCAK